jgi:hypothetical protein
VTAPCNGECDGCMWGDACWEQQATAQLPGKNSTLPARVSTRTEGPNCICGDPRRRTRNGLLRTCGSDQCVRARLAGRTEVGA